MPWGDIKVNLGYIKGDARSDLTDTSSDPNPHHIDAYREDSAKALFYEEVVKKAGGFVIQRGGRSTFLDEVAAVAGAGGALELEVGASLAFAYLHLYYHNARPTSSGRYHDDAIYYLERFRSSVKAFCIVAPAEIQAASDPDIVVANSGTMSSSSPMVYE